ncbi:unnamed protein product [Arctogadus glacialis]
MYFDRAQTHVREWRTRSAQCVFCLTAGVSTSSEWNRKKVSPLEEAPVVIREFNLGAPHRGRSFRSQRRDIIIIPNRSVITGCYVPLNASSSGHSIVEKQSQPSGNQNPHSSKKNQLNVSGVTSLRRKALNNKDMFESSSSGISSRLG